MYAINQKQNLKFIKINVTYGQTNLNIYNINVCNDVTIDKISRNR